MTVETLRQILPRIVLALLLLSGSGLAFFESVYLGDQARLIGDAKIEFWMWAFRGVAAVALVVSGIVLVKD